MYGQDWAGIANDAEVENQTWDVLAEALRLLMQLAEVAKEVRSPNLYQGCR
jgi:hypothetical protein